VIARGAALTLACLPERCLLSRSRHLSEARFRPALLRDVLSPQGRALERAVIEQGRCGGGL